MPNFRIIDLNRYPLTRNLQGSSDDINYNFSLITGGGGTSGSGFPFSGSAVITGSLIVSGGNITGTLIGTASWAFKALTASYFSGSISNAISASYAATASYVISSSYASSSTSASYALTASFALNAGASSQISFFISTGSITASVGVGANNLFLIKSSSVDLFSISSSGDTTLSSNLFIVKNYTTQKPVFTISQSIVQIATQSAEPTPTGTALAGSIWFSSTNFYVSLD